MEYFFTVETMQSDHDLDGEFPYSLLFNRFTHLALDILAEIAFDTIFHHYIQLIVLDK